MRRTDLARALMAGAGAMALLAFSSAGNGADAAVTLKTLHSFCKGSVCKDGLNPENALLRDAGGNLYGTSQGGKAGQGVLFRITASGEFQTLHSFCSAKNCADGATPMGAPIIDGDGNLYGVTLGGGRNGGGTVYELSPTDKSWKLHTLYDFCSASGCSDGSGPAAGLTYAGAQTGVPYDGSSPLFGTTADGGANGMGVAYELTVKKGVRKETVIHDFCSQSGCADGENPAAAMIVDANGHLFGTTPHGGGGSSLGVVFELSKQSKGYAETVLYTFCPTGGACSDGQIPDGPLVQDAQGNLFGTAFAGGPTSVGGGAIFKVVPQGTDSNETVVYGFCSQTSGSECLDGTGPTGPLAIDDAGDLFGTTEAGGDYSQGGSGGGTIFEITGATQKVLHKFCAKASCPDGSSPFNSGVVIDGSGDLYGTTYAGGRYANGTVFKLAR